MDFSSALIHRSAHESVRRILLVQLRAARSASSRLAKPGDEEALHDFRTSIRRMRATLGIWEDVLDGAVREKHVRRLAAIQRATGAGRDAEVALKWLRDQPEAGDAEPTATAAFVARLSKRLRKALREARRNVRRDFAALEEKLSAQIATFTTELEPDVGDGFGAALAPRLRKAMGKLEKRLSRISALEDEERCHAARIACKRLRYLVEPIENHQHASAVVASCKTLQDVLGEINDAHVLDAQIAADDKKSGGELASSAIGAGNRERLRQLFATLLDQWLGDGSSALSSNVEALAASLAASAAEEEIERKYLLSRLPDFGELRAAGVEVTALEIEQGWLPGTRLNERIRRTSAPGAAEEESSWYRTVKLGTGIRRVEIEEPATRHVFETLWPLTLGRRVRKTRYRVRVGELCWEIDEFRDRDLLLAEVELTNVEEQPELPAWLAGCCKREVTGDGTYQNLNLAR
ncbi:MAG: CHAD domain-containing protein [bacterium]|nr:CHAD domain-containing protein [bacterium]